MSCLIVFERTITTDTHEFMTSHVLDGRAVLPGRDNSWNGWPTVRSPRESGPPLSSASTTSVCSRESSFESQESLQIRVCADAAQAPW